MYGAVEGVVLRENEEDDEGHVHMMRVSLLDMIQDLKNRQHLQRQKDKILYYCVKKTKKKPSGQLMLIFDLFVYL